MHVFLFACMTFSGPGLIKCACVNVSLPGLVSQSSPENTPQNAGEGGLVMTSGVLRRSLMHDFGADVRADAKSPVGPTPPHQSRRWSKHWQLIHKLLRILQLSQRLLALQLSHMLLALQLGPRLLAHLRIVLRLCSRPAKIVGIVQQMSFVRPCWLWALLDKYLQRSLLENWLVYMLKSMTWRTRKTKNAPPSS